MNTDISKYIEISCLINLDNTFVVVKKYTNVTYYYGCQDPSRPSRYSPRSNFKNAKYAILFNSLEEAEKKCNELNSARKRVKFSIEKASRHFVSNFSLVYGWYGSQGRKVYLKNNPVSLQDYRDKKRKVDLSLSKEMLESLTNTLLELEDNNKKYVENFGSITRDAMEQIQAEFNARIKSKNADLTTNLKYSEETLEMCQAVTSWIKDGTLEKIVENNKTECDNKFHILYGDRK